jgi:branched-chain amino acid transport system ATP-binding protein
MMDLALDETRHTTADVHTAKPLLEVRDLHTCHGKIHALKGISFDVHDGEIVTLIGGNGAGKTTTLHTLSRLIPSRSGTVRFSGKDVQNLPPHQIVNLGIAHVPEGRRIFPLLSVHENLQMGGYGIRSKAEIARRIEAGFEMFPRLRERSRQLGGTLSGGEQQMLALARALMQDPKIILLDEPSMGLSPLFVERIFDIIVDINKQGKTILLVEQNAHMALTIADRGYVLQTGEIVLSDTATNLLANEAVRGAYLGESN